MKENFEGVKDDESGCDFLEFQISRFPRVKRRAAKYSMKDYNKHKSRAKSLSYSKN